MVMYEQAKTVVRTVDGDSDNYTVKVGLHQSSTLSPLLFAKRWIKKVISVWLPRELLKADDLELTETRMDE
jgi:hypothetical protein